MKSYDEYVSKYANSFTKVLIDKDYYEKIQAFVEKLTSKKVTESHHRFDHFSETKRFTTGLLGEAALEKTFRYINYRLDNRRIKHISSPRYSWLYSRNKNRRKREIPNSF